MAQAIRATRGDAALLPFPSRAAPAPAMHGCDVAAADRPLLEALRGFARAALLAPPADLDRGGAGLGCSPVDAGPEVAFAAHGAALLRALDAAALRPLTFHNRAARPVTFAEAWLVRLLAALRRGDGDSAAFLIGRGVQRSRRGLVLALARRVAALAPGGARRGG